MAKILNKDPVTYQKERDGFLRELRQFHDSRGTPFRRIPKLHGHEVDLYLLYVLVTAHGGWEKVNSRCEWDSLSEQFCVPRHCVNGGVALKQIYIRFLERYEKVHFLGEDVDRDGDDDDGDSRQHRRWSARTLHSVPLTYNHHQHQVSDQARQTMGLSTETFKSSEYDRLSLSLLSPLPNEQDFAINVCTLLSNEGKHTLRLEKCPRLVDFLLAHAGVYTHSECPVPRRAAPELGAKPTEKGGMGHTNASSSLRDVFSDMFTHMRHQSVNRFWADVVEDKDFRELTDPPRCKEELLPLPHASPPIGAGDSSSTEPLLPLAAVTQDCTDKVEVCSRLQDSPSSSSIPAQNTNNNNISESVVSVPESRTNSDNNDCEMLDLSAPVLVLNDDEVVKSTAEVDTVAMEIVEKVESVAVVEKVVEKVVEVKEEKPKIRMIDVKEEDMPRLPEKDSVSSLFWPPPGEGRAAGGLEFTVDDQEIFCLGRGLGTQDALGQRVLQVATIMRNLSFEEDNIAVLGRNSTFIRFALLCMQSRYNSLAQLGMDMLGQVASELLLEDPHSDTLAAMLVSTVTRGLSSPDRFVVLSSLEVLNKLCQNEDNEEVMLKCLEQKVYDQVCSFLTLHDIMLLIYTLECLYSLSSLGERACNSIVRVHGAIDTLVSLITVEAQSYGPRACILMRVVERLPEQGAQQGSAATPTTGGMSSLGSQNTPTMTQLTSVTPTPIRQASVITRQTITPHRPLLHGTPTAQPQQPSVPTLVQTPQQLQQQHQQQQQLQENEQFALAWLRATYELGPGHTVEQTELYRQYLASCAKIGRRGVIASLHFPRCVRSVFGGTVGPNAKQPSTPGSNTEYHYEGIKVRASAVPLLASPLPATPASVAPRKPASAPTPPPAPVSPAPISVVVTSETVQPPPAPSPILKAQLSAPPKPRETTKPETKSQVLAHPHLTQALLGSSSSQQTQQSSPSPRPPPAASTSSQAGPSSPSPSTSSSSSLIKSLLASKVNTVGESMSMPSIVAASTTASSDVQQHQVAQRQQQQRLLQQQLQQPTASTSTSTLPPPAPHNSPPPLQPITARPRPAILRPTSTDTKGRQVARINGARGVPAASSAVSSTQAADPVKENNVEKKAEGAAENHAPKATHKEAPSLLLPPPPRPRLDEDSDSAASTANSLVSSGGAVSTDGDGENSLTSFEGILLNGIPHSIDIDAANDNEGSRSCDSSKDSKVPALKMKGMLADLLEKKVVTKEPMINGVIGKELRISDKGLEIVENHLEKVLKQENDIKIETPEQIKIGVKRSSTTVNETSDAKKPLLNPPINGNAHSSETDSESSNGTKMEVQENTAVVKQEPVAAPIRQLIITQQQPSAASDSSTGQQPQQLIMGPRQIIVTPGSMPQGQVMISQGQIQVQQPNSQIKGQIIVQPGGQRQVLVQNQQVLVSSGQVVSQPMFVSTQSGGNQQFIVTQALQGSVVSASGQTYMLAQPQGLVQGQNPTVLVTQTPQQQGTNAKTIIILHQQGGQKVAGVTPQGQQVMVQLPRSAVQGGQVTLSQGVGGQVTLSQGVGGQVTLSQGVGGQVTLSQGVGGQVTVTLPGNMPMMTRTVVTTSGANVVQQQVTRTIAPAVVNSKPGAVVTSVANQKKVAQPTVITTTASVQQTKTVITTTPSRPPTPRTPATEGDSKASPATSSTSQHHKPAETSPFLCEWRGCMRSFKSANEVYMHACRTHCPTGSEDVQCLWERCDGMKRKRFSLMTHLYDRHCNSDVLRMMAVRRKQMAQSGRSEIPPPQPPPPHPGYAPNAALHAIKRHALEFVNPKELMQRAAAPAPPAPPRSGPAPAAPPAASRPGPAPAEQDDNEGPVTKSIRLTSSLILRNLVIYSTNGRRFLRSYEPHLASVALSNVESSRTIAQVLYDMSQRTEQS